MAKAAVSPPRSATRRTGRPAPGVYAADFDPPTGDQYLYFTIENKAQRGSNITVGTLSDERLAWIARVVVAEMAQRKRCA